MSLPTNFFIGRGGAAALYDWGAANTSIRIESNVYIPGTWPTEGYLEEGMELPQMRNQIIASNANASNWVNDSNFFTMDTANYQGIGKWTVPFDGLWKIEAGGAGGGTGSATQYAGGRGAAIGGYFNLTAGEVICLLPGQRGSNWAQDVSDTWCGGGGGSFVWRESEVPLGSTPSATEYPLLAAGGGGGASDEIGMQNSANGMDAVYTQNGTSDRGGYISGGSGGNGGSIKAGSYPATAGAGWRSNGQHGHTTCTYTSTASIIPSMGGSGGQGGGNGPPRTIQGGFGGGGGGGQRCGSAGGGGGGGYSGGAGGDYSGSNTTFNADSGGGGGGSYNSGTSTYTSGYVAANTHGYIQIWSPA